MKYFLSVIAVCVSLSACTRTIYISEKSIIHDAEYDSEFPSQPTSDYLEDINNSVKMVNTMSSYHGYEFTMKDGPLKSQIRDPKISEKAIKEKYLNSPASGTATVIFHDPDRVALLTCYHVVQSPDTIINYFLDENGKQTPFIESVYFKVRHTITVTGVPEVNDFEVLAFDDQKDLAVIGKKYSTKQVLNLSVFTYPKGRAEELRMGTFVYVFGFPRGERMVGATIVSRANKDRDHGFVLNTPMHRGISGGLVMAIRDGIPNFEWVGMVFAVAGERIEYLVPERETEAQPSDVQHPYSGDIYLNSTRSIVYGITYAVSIESIELFFQESKMALAAKGFNSDLFLQEKPQGPRSKESNDLKIRNLLAPNNDGS